MKGAVPMACIPVCFTEWQIGTEHSKHNDCSANSIKSHLQKLFSFRVNTSVPDSFWSVGHRVVRNSLEIILLIFSFFFTKGESEFLFPESCLDTSETKDIGRFGESRFRPSQHDSAALAHEHVGNCLVEQKSNFTL